jgi:hypothetical protein
MVDHFHTQVIGQRKIGGEARAMVVTGSINRAIQYYHAIRDYLTQQKIAVPGHCRLLRRARVRRQERHRGVTQRFPEQPDRGQDR